MLLMRAIARLQNIVYVTNSNALRSIVTATICHQDQKQPSVQQTTTEPPVSAQSINPANSTHRTSGTEKRFLVWTGKYKKLEDVPEFVNQEIVERARNRMRIRIANYMMILTVIGCIAMVISGKRAAERGESVTKQNIDWHRQYNEDQKPKADK